MWKRNKIVVVLVLGGIIGFYALRFLLLERYEVTMVNDESWYNYSDDGPMDLSLIKSTLEMAFPKVTLIAEDSISDFLDQSQYQDSLDKQRLFVFFPRKRMASDWYEVLNTITSTGGHVFVSTQNSVPLEKDLFAIIKPSGQDTFDLRYGIETYTHVVPDISGIHYAQRVSGISLPDYYRFVVSSVATAESLYNVEIQGYDELDSIVVDTTYIQLDFNEGTLAIDALPFYFTNLASKEAIFYPHLNYVFSRYELDEVLLVLPLDYEKAVVKTPFSYITSHKGPRWAIYLGLTLSIFYLLNGRRKERAIPLVTPIRNTTMDFVDTVSRLYVQRDKGGMIVLKMMSNFHNHMEARYHITLNRADAWIRLQQVSQVAEHIVNQLKSASENVSKYGADNDLDYSRLHMLLTTFYKQAK